MELLIRNMVCRHCVVAVTAGLGNLGLHPSHVELGKAVLEEPEVDNEQLGSIDRMLEELGFERIREPEEAIVEKTKLAVMEHLRNADNCRLNLSHCIEKSVGMPYPTVSRLFSAAEGRTIEKYHIAQKIEFVKELLADPSLNLAEIADRTGYSSTAHLSRQFKEMTGMPPSQYRKSPGERHGINTI